MRTAPILVTKDQKQTKEARRKKKKKKTSVFGCNFFYFYFLLCCFDLILIFFKGSHFDIYCTKYKDNDLKKKDLGAFKEILHH